ncbi:MAG TPA: nucleoside 2-deoxyribosyltransferase [Candidatus Paceibacterota bacterium]|nr:nucleoside 2-deoxyribosyltransferase [Candidatus Paceibacterota bacterium]
MKAYLAIKFYGDFGNRQLIEDISNALEKVGIDTVVMVRDVERWGEVKFTPRELMRKSFSEIDASDLLIVECSEKGVGLGIEAGYAHAKNIPIFVIAKTGSEISETIEGIVKSVFFYDDPSEIAENSEFITLAQDRDAPRGN